MNDTEAAKGPTWSEEHRLVLVTGPSGAGRSTALAALEDLGYEAIDNLPLTLIPRLLDGPPTGPRMALGVDTRNRDFSAAALGDLVSQLRMDPRAQAELLYLDCSADVLLRRFSETRRRHPMAPAESPVEGIARELDLLAPIRTMADMLIDTSELTLHDLRAELARWFGQEDGPRLAVSIQSFSYKRGMPRGADMVLDCRFLRNPYWEPSLRGLNGLSEEVAAHVAGDPRFAPFFDKVTDLIELLLPAYIEEGKSHLSIAFGCTGGQHRSVTVVEKLTQTLAASGWRVSKRHLELERQGRAGAATQTGTTA
ncbi:MAG: RNase adapter RapZ [Paracoccaceae bacterium]